jgi:hypothetical protein
MMRLLALTGSLALFVYIAVTLWLTSVNLSKHLFADPEGENFFWERQGTILLWPLMIISEEGRAALALIWKKETEE